MKILATQREEKMTSVTSRLPTPHLIGGPASQNVQNAIFQNVGNHVKVLPCLNEALCKNVQSANDVMVINYHNFIFF